MSAAANAPPGTDSNTDDIRAVSRAMPNTVAPRSANNRATAAPRPDDAPVTRATFPDSCAMVGPPGQTWTLRRPRALRSPEQL